LVLFGGVGATQWAAWAAGQSRTWPLDPAWVFLGGVAAAALGVALVAPLLSALASRALVGAGRPLALLTGRAIQADAGGASRPVAALGVAIALMVGGLGVLAAWESTSQYAAALRAVGEGPQQIWVDSADGPPSALLTPAELSELGELEGVLGIAPEEYWGGCSPEDGCDVSALVGTCEQLALLASVDQCDDSAASAIVDSDAGTARRLAGGEAGGTPDSFEFWQVGPDDVEESVGVVELTGPPITVDVDRTIELWGHLPWAAAFVPSAVAPAALEPGWTLEVIAEGGVEVRQRVAAWARPLGFQVWIPTESDFAYLQAVRLTVWSLVCAGLAAALLVMTLSTLDRARERRRFRARLVMAGVAGRVLIASQLIQVLVPAVIAVGLGLAVGAVEADAYLRLGDGPAAAISASHWLIAAGAATAGVLIAALAALPSARPKLTGDLLRRE
jgi:hypothetical protein